MVNLTTDAAMIVQRSIGTSCAVEMGNVTLSHGADRIEFCLHLTDVRENRILLAYQVILGAYTLYQLTMNVSFRGGRIRVLLPAPIDLCTTRGSRVITIVMMILVGCFFREFLLQEVGTASITSKLLSAFLLIPLFMLARFAHCSLFACLVGIVSLTLRISMSVLSIITVSIGRSVSASLSPNSETSTLERFTFKIIFHWPVGQIFLFEAPQLFACALGIVIFSFYFLRRLAVSVPSLASPYSKFARTRLVTILLQNPADGYFLHVKNILKFKSESSPDTDTEGTSTPSAPLFSPEGKNIKTEENGEKKLVGGDTGREGEGGGPYFQFSARFLMAMSGACLFEYFIMIFSLDVVLSLSVSLIALQNAALDILLSLGVELDKKIVETSLAALISCAVILIIIIWIVIVYLVIFQPCRAYKTAILDLRKGKYFFDPSSLGAGDSFRFIGFTLGYCGGGSLYLFAILSVVGTLIITYLVFYFQLPPSLQNKIFWFFWNKIFPVALPAVVTLAANFFIKFFFVGNLFTARNNMSIVHPRVVAWTDCFFSIFTFFSSLFSFVRTFANYFVRIAITAIQCHSPAIGDEISVTDVRYRAYLGCLYLDHRNNNPVLRVFLSLIQSPMRGRAKYGERDTLLEEERDFIGVDFFKGLILDLEPPEKRDEIWREIGEIRERQKSKPFTDAQLKSDTPVDAPETSQTEDQKNLEVLRRRIVAINRWTLAYTLIKNPKLKKYRRRVTPEISSVPSTPILKKIIAKISELRSTPPKGQ